MKHGKAVQWILIHWAGFFLRGNQGQRLPVCCAEAEAGPLPGKNTITQQRRFVGRCQENVQSEQFSGWGTRENPRPATSGCNQKAIGWMKSTKP